MSEATLFELPEPQEQAPSPPTRREEARVLRPVREQLQWLPRDLEAALAQDHPARAIWGLLENLDLAAFYSSIRSVVDQPGRPTTDPQVLLALWLLATVAPDWLRGAGAAGRYQRYSRRVEDDRLPESQEKGTAYAQTVGEDGFRLLDLLKGPEGPFQQADCPG